MCISQGPAERDPLGPAPTSVLPEARRPAAPGSPRAQFSRTESGRFLGDHAKPLRAVRTYPEEQLRSQVRTRSRCRVTRAGGHVTSSWWGRAGRVCVTGPSVSPQPVSSVQCEAPVRGAARGRAGAPGAHDAGGPQPFRERVLSQLVPGHRCRGRAVPIEVVAADGHTDLPSLKTSARGLEFRLQIRGPAQVPGASPLGPHFSRILAGSGSPVSAEAPRHRAGGPDAGSDAWLTRELRPPRAGEVTV